MSAFLLDLLLYVYNCTSCWPEILGLWSKQSLALLYIELFPTVIYAKSQPKLVGNRLHRVQSDMLQNDVNEFLAIESSGWTRERYEIRSLTWYVISTISVSVLEKGPNNYVKLSHLKTMAFCFTYFYASLICQVVGRILSFLLQHTLQVTPLGTAGVISCLGDHIVGDGQTSHLPPLPVPEPQKVKLDAATKDVVGKQKVADALWFKHHLLSLSFHGNSGKSMMGFWHSLLSPLLLLYLFHIFHPFLFSFPFL